MADTSAGRCPAESARVSVHYLAELGGFSLARLRPYMGPGRVFPGNASTAPVPGPAALIPCTGPVCYHLFLTGTRLGDWVGRGLERGPGQGMQKKTPRPRPLRGAGRGKGPRAHLFRRHVRPVTTSSEGLIGVPSPRGIAW